MSTIQPRDAHAPPTGHEDADICTREPGHPSPVPAGRLHRSSWWSVPGSNRRPPACKAGALPAELTPRLPLPAGEMVGRGGLEPPTSRLSGVRSNHLSYRPAPGAGTTAAPASAAAHQTQRPTAWTPARRRNRRTRRDTIPPHPAAPPRKGHDLDELKGHEGGPADRVSRPLLRRERQSLFRALSLERR